MPVSIGKLRVAAHLWCMCGADLGEPLGYVKCACGMGYRLRSGAYELGLGRYTSYLSVVDDVRPETVRYLELARAAETAVAAFEGLFGKDGIPAAGVSRRVLLAAKHIAVAARRAESDFVRELEKRRVAA